MCLLLLDWLKPSLKQKKVFYHLKPVRGYVLRLWLKVNNEIDCLPSSTWSLFVSYGSSVFFELRLLRYPYQLYFFSLLSLYSCCAILGNQFAAQRKSKALYKVVVFWNELIPVLTKANQPFPPCLCGLFT